MQGDALRQNYVNLTIKPITMAKMASASVNAIPTNMRGVVSEEMKGAVELTDALESLGPAEDGQEVKEEAPGPESNPPDGGKSLKKASRPSGKLTCEEQAEMDGSVENLPPTPSQPTKEQLDRLGSIIGPATVSSELQPSVSVSPWPREPMDRRGEELTPVEMAKADIPMYVSNVGGALRACECLRGVFPIDALLQLGREHVTDGEFLSAVTVVLAAVHGDDLGLKEAVSSWKDERVSTSDFVKWAATEVIVFTPTEGGNFSARWVLPERPKNPKRGILVRAVRAVGRVITFTRAAAV